MWACACIALRNGVMCIAVVDLDGRLKQPLLRATVAQGERSQSSAAPRVLKGVDAVAQQVGRCEQQEDEGAGQHLHGPTGRELACRHRQLQVYAHMLALPCVQPSPTHDLKHAHAFTSCKSAITEHCAMSTRAWQARCRHSTATVEAAPSPALSAPPGRT